jgi:cyanophycinase
MLQKSLINRKIMKRKPKGKLLAIGGNEHSSIDGENYVQRNNPDFIPDEIFKRYIEECRYGTRSRIGIITTCAGEPRRTAENFRDVFHRLDCHRIEILDIRSEREANDPENLQILEKLDGVFFSGGDQARIERYIVETEFSAILFKKYFEEDFIIAGTSSGAMAMADQMISRGSAMEGFVKGEVKITDGLSLIRNVVIDTHFDARGRFMRLVQAACNDKVLGLGIAEDTAVLIKGEEKLEVVGSGVVTVIETKNIFDTNFDEVDDGAPFTVSGLVVHILSRNDVYKMKDIFAQEPVVMENEQH